MIEQAALKVDLADGSLFGNDAGEDELPEVLASYFLDQPAFRSFLSKDVRFQIARSRKGMGKSALISKLAYDLSADPDQPVVVRATGANLLGIASPPTGGYLELQNYWTKVICARINYELGKNLGFTFSETDMALVESSEMSGFKERNIVGALLQRIKSSKIPIEIVSREYGNHEELLRRALESHGERTVWLLVDDIDSTYVDSPEQQAVTSTFFSACRAIARDMKHLNVRVSVRSDVWSNFRKNEDLDKCEQYVTDISWTSPDLQILLSKKIYSYFLRNFPDILSDSGLGYRKDSEQLLEFAFTQRMRWGQAHVRPFRPISVLSAGRPRWMAQLCRLAGLEAAKEGKTAIGITEINWVMKRYSRFRLNDIYKEHSHQFGQLERLIETFSNSPARYNTGELLTQISVNYINKIGSGNIPHLDGFPYKYPMQLAHFLYRIGFIVGRREHAGNPNLADFTRFEERPELLTDTRNPDDGLQWEVHPSYRAALSIGKAQKVANRRQQTQRDARH